jgi:hypothetical protein
MLRDLPAGGTQVRVWLASQRNAMASAATPRDAVPAPAPSAAAADTDVDSDAPPATITALACRVMARAWFLLELAPAEPAASHVRVLRPCDPPVAFSSLDDALGAGAAEGAGGGGVRCRGWWRVRCMLHVSRWWRRVARSGAAARRYGRALTASAA